MNKQQFKSAVGYSPRIVETAFNIWEQLEVLSSILWETFGDRFVEIDELRTMLREQRRADSQEDLPF